MNNVFITGIAGFLGSHLATQLVQAGKNVSGIDNLLGGDPYNVPPEASWSIGDATDLPLMKYQLAEIDTLYHCAAAPHEALSLFSPVLINHHTYTSTIATITAAIEKGVRRIVYTSSAARYGTTWPGDTFIESDRPMPEDPYGVAKYAGELALQALSKVHGFEYVIAVPHNIIGPRQKYDDPYRNVASIMINLMLQDRQPIIYGDGEQTRSFSFVQDCVVPMALMGDGPFHGHVINVGPEDDTITVNELARRIAGLLNFSLDPIYVPARPAEVKHVRVSAKKAERLLGYKASTSLDDGLAQMIEWIQRRGPRPFDYHLPIEIDSERVPTTWKQRLF